MKNYKDLKIYQAAYELAVEVHKASFMLPKFECYEQGSQIRRSSKSVKDNIVEGYGRRRYKAEFIRFLVFAHSSNDETINHLETIELLYPEIEVFKTLKESYDDLGRR